VRQLLARVLSEVANSSLQEDLLALADDSIPELRAAAARSMGHAHRLHALDVLFQLVSDPVWFVRLRAAVALGELRREEAVPALVQLLTDSNRLVRIRAAEGLIDLKSDLAAIFEQVVATGDRYGLHAYLAALDNASAREELADSIKRSGGHGDERSLRLLRVLEDGQLPKAEGETVQAEPSGGVLK
jgi:HEAT repeat protein